MRLSGSTQPDKDANPYALLYSNFDSEFYDRDINIYKESNQMSSRASPAAEMVMRSASDNSEFNLTNFTYDKMDEQRQGDGLMQGRPSKRMTNNLVNIAVTKKNSNNALREQQE